MSCALQVPRNDSEIFLNFSAQIGAYWFGDRSGSGPVPVTVLKIQKSDLNTGTPVWSIVNRLRNRYGTGMVWTGSSNGSAFDLDRFHYR